MRSPLPPGPGLTLAAGATVALAATATLALTTLGGLTRGGFPGAERGGGARSPLSVEEPAQESIPYDGRFTFVRIQYEPRSSGFDGFGRGRFGGGREPAWAHDYPRADINFEKIVRATTFIDNYLGGSRVLRMDDPEVFKYPIIYVIEVGSWAPDAKEIEALGTYLRKGGFLIVDDFRDRQIDQLWAIVQRALPGMQILEVPTDHEIFDSFFHIPDPYSLLPPYGRGQPLYLGLFEDNDPSKRLMAVFNYNQDISEYWEFSDVGYYPIDLSNEAYKFGVNYLVYGMTH